MTKMITSIHRRFENIQYGINIIRLRGVDMCYFLYGAVNGGLNKQDYDNIMKNFQYRFNIGDIGDVNACVEKCGDSYRITTDHCDCGTPLGSNHTNKDGLKEFEKMLIRLKSVRRIKYILLSKNWANETNSKQKTVHINDIDILHFLANVEDNCLYKIELYPKYY